MVELLLWGIVIAGYLLALYLVYRTIVFGLSLSREAPFVPSNLKLATEALRLLGIKKGDQFIDIGSGVGMVVFLASKLSKGVATYSGIEQSKALTLQSKIKQVFSRYNKQISFVNGDALVYNYTGFNEVYLYMTTHMTDMLMHNLSKQLPANAKVVSVAFGMGSFMKSHKVEVHKVVMGDKEHNLYLWKNGNSVRKTGSRQNTKPYKSRNKKSRN